MFKLTPPLVNWPGPDCDDDREDGFTLIEILVVIIIIGILAAVAIPIFLNQQKSARDSQTTSDTRNAATALETGMVYDSTATTYHAFADDNGEPGEWYEDGVVPEGEREFWVQVGSGPKTQSVKTEGTHLKVGNDDIDGDGAPDAGAFRIDAWNGGGLEWGDENNTLVYRNALGGIQSTSGSAGESSGPGGESEGSGGGDGTENPGGDSTAASAESWRTPLIFPTAREAVGAGAETSVTFGVEGTKYSPEAVTFSAPDGTVIEWKAETSFDSGAGETVATGSSVVSGSRYSTNFTLPDTNGGDTGRISVSVTKVTFPDGSELTEASSSLRGYNIPIMRNSYMGLESNEWSVGGGRGH